MINLVTLQQAKAHLRITDSNSDYDVQLKVAMASDIVMDYLKLKSVPSDWTQDTSPVSYDVPALIQAAALLATGELYSNREASIVDVLSPAMVSLLERYRDPALA